METPENRLKRLHMRSWRRGMKEMDLILGHFADDCLAGLAPGDLDLYERMLGENDQDLYLWVTGRIGDAQASGRDGPPHLGTMLDRVARHASQRLAPDS
ncbi:MAG: succinate dehydrogenase assembly factor 2 [Alphaproteobacteria bacterium]|nr:succinate dehydrogenase assembly factor 2 [Alphaproteobacteria bacterium]